MRRQAYATASLWIAISGCNFSIAGVAAHAGAGFSEVGCVLVAVVSLIPAVLWYREGRAAERRGL